MPYYRTSKNSETMKKELSILAQDHSKPMLSVMNESEASYQASEHDIPDAKTKNIIKITDAGQSIKSGSRIETGQTER